MTETRAGYINFEEWYKSFYANNLLLMFKGEFKQELIRAIVGLIEGINDVKNESEAVKKRLFGTVIECLQNICRHAAPTDSVSGLKTGILMVAKHDDGFTVSTGNLVFNTSRAKLTSYLEKVNEMNTTDLNLFQKEILKNTELYGKHGSDLGLVNIAKVIKKPFNFRFKPLNDKHSFFSFEVNITSNDDY